jgi:hypothetical protein
MANFVGSQKAFDDAFAALKRVQEFDTSTLPRESDLGKMNFKEGVEPAQTLVNLFKRLSLRALEDFPDNQLEQVKSQSLAAYAQFNAALTFDLSPGDAQNRRNGIIAAIRSRYTEAFNVLHPLIAYSLHRSADFGRLETEARATLQSMADEAERVRGEVQKSEKSAQESLAAIRKVAAEQGVTQQAIHFKSESDHHEEQAELWRKRTVILAWVVGIYAALSILVHKIPFLQPGSAYESFQLGLSKTLVFAVLAYMLFLAARNFMNHRHNAIVNKHRQNALMTHKALVEAVNDQGARDAVMLQAANCIFSPQPTGYAESKAEGDAAPRSVIELLSRTASSAAGK